MNRSATLFAVLVMVSVAAAGGYWVAAARAGRSAAPPANPPDAPGTPDTADSARRVLYWHDPMYPQQRFDRPGRSPFMDMELVPVYANDAADDGQVSISPRIVQSLGIRTAKVERQSLAPRLSAVGAIAYNERSIVQMQARSNGFVERLYVRAPLDAVSRGQPLVEVLFPDWAAAQGEFLLALHLGNPDVARAARQRLLLLGMSEAQIAGVELSGATQPRITLHAPVAGVVAELGIREGMTVTVGSTLFRIADLSSVWVNAEMPEAQAALLRPGISVEVRVLAWPGESFAGFVVTVLPELAAVTRTVRARIELANPDGRLKPGMFASVDFHASEAADALLVPGEAVIRTGERAVVMLAEGDGRFRPVDVTVGRESGDRTEILEGLKVGDEVVVSGQFLLDSEASLKSAVNRASGDTP